MHLTLIFLCLGSVLGSLPTGPYCKAGWNWIGGKCYKINLKHKATWSTAKNECEKHGGQLFTPSTENEDDAGWDVYQKEGGVYNYWYNIKDLQGDLGYKLSPIISNKPTLILI